MSASTTVKLMAPCNSTLTPPTVKGGKATKRKLVTSLLPRRFLLGEKSVLSGIYHRKSSPPCIFVCVWQLALLLCSPFPSANHRTPVSRPGNHVSGSWQQQRFSRESGVRRWFGFRVFYRMCVRVRVLFRLPTVGANPSKRRGCDKSIHFPANPPC